MLSWEKGSQGSVKTIGIIGGIGPESTVEYYRSIIAFYSERIPDGSYPSIIINSIDLKKVLDLVSANELPELADYLVTEIQRLARAGAECGLVAANTPHIVFNEVRRRSPIRLISIVEATRSHPRAHLRRDGALSDFAGAYRSGYSDSRYDQDSRESDCC
jgi:aspartate racemase